MPRGGVTADHVQLHGPFDHPLEDLGKSSTAACSACSKPVLGGWPQAKPRKNTRTAEKKQKTLDGSIDSKAQKNEITIFCKMRQLKPLLKDAKWESQDVTTVYRNGYQIGL